MKILITTDWYQPVVNGVVTSVVNLTKGLQAMGHEVRVLTLSGTLNSYKEENAVYIGSIGVGKVYPDARMRTALAHRYIKELILWHPDIVHSQCEFSSFFLAKKIARSCNVPIIHTYHTVYEDYTHYFSPNVHFGKFVAAFFSKRVLSKTEAVIVPTEKVRDMLVRYGVKQPITTIPSGLELSRFLSLPLAGKERALRLQLEIGADKKILVYVGRLAAEKNIEELFQLLSAWKRKDLVLLLVGDGPYRETLTKLAKEMNIDDQVVFTGMVPPSQIADYYRLGDIFVSASRSETQGLTYIEAMTSGLPIVCHADDCLNSVVDDGFNGFQYHSAVEFRAMVERLLENERFRQSIGENAVASVKDRFSMDRFSEDVAALYQKLICS